MDQGFQSHRLRPGDPGYVYDRRIDFSAEEPNDWDEEEEGEEQQEDQERQGKDGTKDSFEDMPEEALPHEESVMEGEGDWESEDLDTDDLF